jgi:DMSO/TMAO reductase YedYZ molybdopterin-dependent catalytic subunit
VVDDFPVLSTGPTPHMALEEWSLTIDGAVMTAASWSWAAFRDLQSETFTVDIHCVTRWSKLGTSWSGVSLDRLLQGVATKGAFVSAWCGGGYTTEPAAGGPDRREGVGGAHVRGRAAGARARLSGALPVPHLYLWKSAKWLRRV